MKQHITIDQLKELAIEDIAKLLNENILFAKFIIEDYGNSFFNIGKMIEILKYNHKYKRLPEIHHNYDSGKHYIDVSTYTRNTYIRTYNYVDKIECNELCDALWQAIKLVLDEIRKELV